MKKLSFLLLLLVVVFGGCKKNYYSDNGPNGGNDTTNTDPSYIIQGITDFSISTDNPARFMNISVIYQSKAQEHVDISVEGLPAGLYLKVTNPSGIPTFTSNLQFYDSSAAVGVYLVKLITNGSITGKKTLSFNITVTAVPDCAAQFAGAFAAHNVCASGPSNFTENITIPSTVANRIILNNFENSGVQLYANVLCNNQAFVIPSQTVNGNTYSGSGSFWVSGSTQQLELDYTKVFGTGGSTSCSVNMSR